MTSIDTGATRRYCNGGPTIQATLLAWSCEPRLSRCRRHRHNGTTMEVVDILVIGFHQPESLWWFGTWLSLGPDFRLARITWIDIDVL